MAKGKGRGSGGGSGNKTRRQGRDAGDGRFITVAEANRRPKTTVIERVPNPGHGDTGRGKKK